jgi:hypothetical protein
VPACQPAGHADVVRVHVSADDALDRPRAQGSGKRPLPVGSGVVGLHAGVDERPTLLIRERPDVDVGETGHGQPHAQPHDPGSDLERFARRRGCLERVTERVGGDCGGRDHGFGWERPGDSIRGHDSRNAGLKATAAARAIKERFGLVSGAAALGVASAWRESAARVPQEPRHTGQRLTAARATRAMPAAGGDRCRRG